jgi:hypothetical protein
LANEEAVSASGALHCSSPSLPHCPKLAYTCASLPLPVR